MRTFLLFAAATVATACHPMDNPKECAALEALARSTNYENWHATTDPQYKDKWLSENSMCTWIGVRCHGEHRGVYQLHMAQFGMTGEIPPEVGDLAELEVVDFMINSMSTRIPPEIGNLKKLKRLLLWDGNDLYGKIPEEMGNLAALEDFYLRGHPNLQGPIPESFTGLSNLKNLHIYGTNLTGAIPDLSVANLESINLANNAFTSAPASLCNLEKGTRCFLSGNGFMTIPACLVDTECLL